MIAGNLEYLKLLMKYFDKDTRVKDILNMYK